MLLSIKVEYKFLGFSIGSGAMDQEGVVQQARSVKSQTLEDSWFWLI